MDNNFNGQFLNESKIVSDFRINSNAAKATFTKNTSGGNAPKPSDIHKMIKNISKKEGE